MMLKLTAEEDFMNARLKYDAVQKAIKKAEILRLSPIECQPLFAEKYKLQDDFKAKKEKVIAAQINNIVNLNDGWYGILYKNGKKTEMLVSPLNSEHLDSIKIDFTTDRLKERDEYTQFVNDNFNQTILNKYMNKVQRKADEYLKQFFDCQDTIRKNDKTYFLTYHCIKRWNERVNNSNDKFDVNQRKEIVSNIESSFKKSNCVYYMEETETEYYLNQEDMVLFVITNDDVIATLWVNNFGFSDKEINKVITLMQLQKIKSARDNYNIIKKEYNNDIQMLHEDEQIFANQLFDVNEQIKFLVKQRNELQDKKDEIQEKILKRRTELNKEYLKLQHEENIIFKPQKLVSVDEEQTSN